MTSRCDGIFNILWKMDIPTLGMGWKEMEENGMGWSITGWRTDDVGWYGMENIMVWRTDGME